MTDDFGVARTKRLVRGVGSSLVARGVTSIAPLVLIPITLGYLGEETYGIWMALTSVTSMFLWADLGLGNTLMTRLAPVIVDGDWQRARALVSSAYRILLHVTLAGFLLIGLAAVALPWEEILNAPGSDDARWIALVCLIAFVLNVPLSLIHRLLFALQRVPESNLLQLGGAFLALSGGAIAVAVHAAPLAVISVVVFGPAAVNALGTVVILRGSKLRPSLGLQDAATRGLITSGLRFVLIGVMSAVALNADYLIVAHGAGVRDVALYSVVTRIFLALGLLITVVNLPLWPANAEALARGDRAWVRRSSGRMVLLSAGSVLLVGAVLTAAKDPILQLFTGEETTTASSTLVVGFVATWTLFALASPLFMVQNAAGHLGPQTIAWAAYLIVSVPAKVMVAEHHGVDWIPWTAFLVYAVTVLPSSIVGFRRALRSPTEPTPFLKERRSDQ